MPPPPSACEQYCDAVASNCVGDNHITFVEDCATDCADWPVGQEGDVNDGTTYCRLYHALAAVDDPELHCPHASTDGGGVCVSAEFCNQWADTCGEWTGLTSCADWWDIVADDPTPDEDTVTGANKGCSWYHLSVARSYREEETGDFAEGQVSLHCGHAIGEAPCVDDI